MIGYLFKDEFSEVSITRQITDRFFAMEKLYLSKTAIPVLGFILILIALTIDNFVFYLECGRTNTAFFLPKLMKMQSELAQNFVI